MVKVTKEMFDIDNYNETGEKANEDRINEIKNMKRNIIEDSIDA